MQHEDSKNPQAESQAKASGTSLRKDRDETLKNAKGIIPRLAGCLLLDQPKFETRLRRIFALIDEGKPSSQELEKLSAAVSASEKFAAARLANLPKIAYPEELPIAARLPEISRILEQNQVLIIAGETGSGKTTQLPKLCLEMGRGKLGMIGITQPRRIAAISAATRVAQELESPLGQVVGYKIRFASQLKPEGRVAFMTDGILLAETHSDRDLLAYDTLIIDEAHERSLNVDFLLGYLKRLLTRRPSLKLIVSSATLDVERFAAFFQAGEGKPPAPIISVEGRSYPVTISYRQVREEDDDSVDLSDAVADAAAEVMRGSRTGDTLVFLSGERDIREAADALGRRALAGVEIMPLFARLSASEQARVFSPGSERRVVLATNVAETSLTIPRIRFVIDTGFARVNRYNPRTGVERLQAEAVSQASANQRAGRCGRIGPGTCIRLYSEADFKERPLFSDPEILRASLASVILRMKALGLGRIEEFPFLDPPAPRAVRDGYSELEELGALDDDGELTKVGERLAQLPVEPRVARMILAAADEGCLSEALTVAAALSIQDPRERPLDRQQQADTSHRRFMNDRSDFSSWLALWKFFCEEAAKAPSKNQLRRLCHESFLSYVRMREWQNVREELADTAEEMGFREGKSEGGFDQLHRAMLAGFLGRLGMYKPDDREYLGARGGRFLIWPGSTLAKKPPRWVVAAEFVETSRFFARDAAEIDPAWVEQVAPQLCKRSYSDPHWEANSGFVRAFERVTVFGLQLVERRPVHYGPIAPVLARELFIRNALVGGDYRPNQPLPAFLTHNIALAAEARNMAQKARKPALVADAESLFEFYDQRLPAGMHNRRDFDHWRRPAEKHNPNILYMPREELLAKAAIGIDPALYPDFINVNKMNLRLSYRFAPGEPDDGITVAIPFAALAGLPEWRFQWLVPGYLREKIDWMFRGLPRLMRRQFVPIPDTAAKMEAALVFGAKPLREALSVLVQKQTGAGISNDVWPAEDKLPINLQMRYNIIDEKGASLASGRDFAALRQRLKSESLSFFDKLPQGEWKREGITGWDFPQLPEMAKVEGNGLALTGYPGLVDMGESVALRTFASVAEAERSTRPGLRRLFALQLKEESNYLRKKLLAERQMANGKAAPANLLRKPDLAAVAKADLASLGADKPELLCHKLGGRAKVAEDIILASIDTCFIEGYPACRDAKAFHARLEEKGSGLYLAAARIEEVARQALPLYQLACQRLARQYPMPIASAAEEMRTQLGLLVYPGCFLATSPSQLAHLPRYIEALLIRLARLQADPGKDRKKALQIAPHWEGCRALLDMSKCALRENPELESYRWLVEEFRVSLFAQELGTACPASEKRLEEARARIGK